jgi:hypothetical protein
MQQQQQQQQQKQQTQSSTTSKDSQDGSSARLSKSFAKQQASCPVVLPAILRRPSKSGVIFSTMPLSDAVISAVEKEEWRRTPKRMPFASNSTSTLLIDSTILAPKDNELVQWYEKSGVMCMCREVPLSWNIALFSLILFFFFTVSPNIGTR